MILNSLKLHNFRNLINKDFTFHPDLTIISGQNAIGKTNLLEAIHFILTGSGVKEESLSELVTIDQPKSTIFAVFNNIDSEIKIASTISIGTTTQRKLTINGVEKNISQLQSSCPPIVLFTPRLLAIIDTDPSARRQYFDRVLARIDKTYATSLTNYQNAITKRNKLLARLVNQPNKLQDELVFWDDYLIKHAQIIQQVRQDYCNILNSDPILEKFHFQVQYLLNPINTETLKSSHLKSLILFRTLVGPQRDDFRITLINDKYKDEKIDVHTYGSRSQQRMALFWLKLHELNIFKDKFQKNPMLLLDDIISELDETNQSLTFQTIKNHQTILTTTESPEFLDLNQDFSVIKL